MAKNRKPRKMDEPPAVFPAILHSGNVDTAQDCIDAEPYLKCGNVWEAPANNLGPCPGRGWWFHRQVWLIVREDQAPRFVGLVWNPPGSSLHGRPGWSIADGWRAIPMNLLTAFISIRDNAEPGSAFCIWLAQESDLRGYLDQWLKHPAASVK